MDTVVDWIIENSGGYIKNEKQAYYAVVGVVVIIWVFL